MRRLAIVLTLAMTSCSALPWTRPDLAEEVQSLYDEIAAGVAARDLDRVTQFSDEHATATFADGTTTTLAQWKDAVRAHWANVVDAKAAIVVTSATARADGADVDYRETHDKRILDPKTSAEHSVHYDGEWSARLVRTPDGLRIERSRELRRRITVDGALVDERSATPSTPAG